MPNLAKDLTGKKFGLITVLNIAKKAKNGEHVRWNVKCDCGKEYTVFANNLQRNKSCGCLQRVDIQNSLITQVKSSYVAGARNRGISFNLTRDEFAKLILSNCVFCGSEPSNTKKRYNETRQYNGIDRIDSNKGYELNNVQTCCWKCNLMKNSLNQSDFLEHIKKIIKFWDNK